MEYFTDQLLQLNLTIITKNMIIYNYPQKNKKKHKIYYSIYTLNYKIKQQTKLFIKYT